VYAATFAEAYYRTLDGENAAKCAHEAVLALRTVKVAGRREQSFIKMLCDFRLDDEKD
jgi:hypothetical protein